ncbi:MAG: hypothetical protein IAE90_07535 [Ignavibacteria bacterium]|nr:hypothetical protein [Ignavibacteria bacterium]
MKLKGKAIEILTAFTTDEISHFRKFLASPYFNTNSALVQLAEIILRYHPLFVGNGFTAESVYARAFKGRSYNDKVMKNLMSSLYSLLKDFLAHQKLRINQAGISAEAADELMKRNLAAIASMQVNRSLKEFALVKALDDSDFRLLSALKETETLSKTAIKGQQFAAGPAISSTEAALCNLLISAIGSHNYAISNEFNYNIKTELEVPGLFFSHVDLTGIKKRLNIEEDQGIRLFVYIEILELLKNKYNMEPGGVKKICEILTLNKRLFGKRTLSMLVPILQNYYYANIGKGSSNLLEDVFLLIEFSLEEKLYKETESQYMPYLLFQNIIAIAFWLEKISWAEDFIRAYSKEMPPDIRSAAVNHSMARLFYQKNDFAKALTYLVKAEESDSMDKFHIKGMIMNCHYEMGNNEEFFLAVDSFTKFLSGNRKVNQIHRNHHLEYIRIMSQLIKYRLKDKPLGIDDIHVLEILHGFILDSKVLSPKDYLLKKTRELIDN